MPTECKDYYGVVFDLDDTLLSTSPAYYKAFVQMMVMLYEDTGVHFVTPEEVIEVYDTIVKMGSKNWETNTIALDLGIDWAEDVSDFPHKLVDTYIECCLRAKTMPRKETALKIQTMSNKALSSQKSYKMMPDAMKVLRYLIGRQNVRLFLITAGPSQLQQPKIEARSIFKHFDRVTIVPNVQDVHRGHKGVVIKEWQKEFDYITEWIVVGDSVPIDINPALAAGCFAIHVVDNQCYLARGEVIAIPNLKEHYIRAEDMAEVYDLLARGLLNATSKVSFQERARSLCSLKEAIP